MLTVSRSLVWSRPIRRGDLDSARNSVRPRSHKLKGEHQRKRTGQVTESSEDLLGKCHCFIIFDIIASIAPESGRKMLRYKS